MNKFTKLLGIASVGSIGLTNIVSSEEVILKENSVILQLDHSQSKMLTEAPKLWQHKIMGSLPWELDSGDKKLMGKMELYDTNISGPIDGDYDLTVHYLACSDGSLQKISYTMDGTLYFALDKEGNFKKSAPKDKLPGFGIFINNGTAPHPVVEGYVRENLDKICQKNI